MLGNPKPKYKLPDPDTYIAWLISLVDVGTQTSTGKFGVKTDRKIRLTWELCGTQASTDDLRPLTISQEYTWSLKETSNLYKLVKPWIGKNPGSNFMLESLFDVPAQVNVVHSDGPTTYANIGTIMPLPKGTKPPERVNTPFVFDMDDLRTSVMDFLKLPEWLRNKILKSPEGKAKFAAEGDGTPEIAEDLPF